MQTTATCETRVGAVLVAVVVVVDTVVVLTVNVIVDVVFCSELP
jgi:hypothetical protein